VQLIYRPKGYEGDSKDYEFSRRSMDEHWQAGYYDAVHALRHPEIFRRSTDRYTEAGPQSAGFDAAVSAPHDPCAR
jgi:hypothetical protein